ncbi:type II secretion system protein [Mycoplasmatota bacterium WC30]
MRTMNNKGITLLETIASIIIISFVVVSIFTIVVNISTQTVAANERINAIEIGTLVREQLENNLSYSDLNTLLDGDITVTNNDYSAIDNFPNEVFSQTLDGTDFSDLITITFFEMTSDHTRFGVIDYKITINYFSNREVELEGIIYE